jgi:hypothetical protein
MSLDLYTDEFGRIHDKPCIDGKPSSNNGWLYSAVAKKLGAPVSVDVVYAHLCADARVRHLHKHLPPISRDEVIGLTYLGFADEFGFHEYGWNFSPYELPVLNIPELIKQLWECRGKHRNHFWENKLSQVYHLAFMVPMHDRHFILRCQGKFNVFYWAVARASELGKPSNKSSRLIRFLKTGEDREAVRNYFGDNHPLCQYI